MLDWPWRRKDYTQIWTWPHLFWMNLFGWWAEEVRTEGRRIWLIRYRNVTYVYQGVAYTCMLIAMVSKIVNGNVAEKMYVVYTASSVMNAVFKEYSLVSYRKSLKSVMEFVDDTFREVKNEDEGRIVRKGVKKCWIIFVGYFTFGSLVLFHWCFRPVIVYISAGEMTKVVDSWPEVDTWNQFVISYAIQFLGIATAAHAETLCDNFFFCNTEIILCQFTLLKERLRKIKLKKEDRNSEELVYCIRFYARLMRACADLRNFSTLPIIVHSGRVVLNQCSTVFIVTMVHQATFSYYNFLQACLKTSSKYKLDINYNLRT